MSMATHNLTKQRIGILGGTFDPIHNGHLYPAIACIDTLALDQLLLLPAHIPPHKNTTVASAEHRKNMVALASKTHKKCQLDARELLRDTPSYTVETLKEISQQQPNWQLFFIIGMDSLLTFTSWFQWRDILKYCHLIVTVRPGYQRDTLSKENLKLLRPFFTHNHLRLTTTHAGLIGFVQQKSFDISSTNIRHSIRDGEINQNDMPKEVANYIFQHNLYR